MSPLFPAAAATTRTPYFTVRSARPFPFDARLAEGLA